MSTYYNPQNKKSRASFEDCPEAAVDFFQYLTSIRGLSPRSVNAYYIDLRLFFKFLKQHRGLAPQDVEIETITIDEIDMEFIRKTTKTEIYEFLYFLTNDRHNEPNVRARKLSSLRGFFKYLYNKKNLMDHNPTDDVESPKLKKTLPKYLSLDESLSLLEHIQSDFYERDYCIITLFLNCGMRLSELVAINMPDVKQDTLRVVGKGNKERTIYLNGACQDALQKLVKERASMENLKDRDALFVSKRTGKRLTARRVQQIVDNCLQAADLDGKGYSTHKLRHTAATLMYRHGSVDVLALKEILGHSQLSTTQIYTHLDSEQLRDAANASPLAKERSAGKNLDNRREKTEKKTASNVGNDAEDDS